MRRTMIVTALVAVMSLFVTPPAQAIIHEIVASHCNGQEEELHPSVDPPGQLRDGQSFARALQATGVFTPVFGVDQGGVLGLDLTTDPPSFGPMPSPGEGETSLTVFVDNTKPSAKLGDHFVWGHIQEGSLHIYIQLYDLDHPAFENCPNFHDHA